MYKIKTIKNISEFLSEAEFSKKYPQFKELLSKDNCEWNQCFNYAFDNNNLEDCENAFNFLKNEYTETKKCKPGDIVLFFNQYDIPLHYAILVKTHKNINDISVKGKFGDRGVYQHKLRYTPVMYGNQVKFYTYKGLKND